ncbi:MAG: hypothetical protein ACRDHE_18355 [Ktedonobacterales bacterium]
METGSHGDGFTSYATVNGVASTFPYVLSYGALIAGVTASAVVHSRRGIRAARISLWLLTLAFCVGVIIALASIGVILLPALVSAIVTSTLAADAGDKRTVRSA